MILIKPYTEGTARWTSFSTWFLREYICLFLLRGMRVIDKKKFKEYVFFFVPWFNNIEKIVNKFWQHNANKIQDWYTLQRRDDDLIISASLSFVIKPALDMLNIKNYITTNFSIKTGKIIGDNCYGNVKQVEFERIYPKTKLEAFYSDSMSDMPMFEISQKAYLIENGMPKEINTKN